MAKILGRGAQGRQLARRLVRRGITTRAALRCADVLRLLPGDSQLRVLYPIAPTIPFARAATVAGDLLKRLQFRTASGAIFRPALRVVGSLRRGHPQQLSAATPQRVKDIDILVALPERQRRRAGRILGSAHLARPAPLKGSSGGDAGHAEIVGVHAVGERRWASIVRWTTAAAGERYYRVDLYLAIGDELPFALYHYTGSKTYNIRTRAAAKRRGWLLNQYGLFERKSERRAGSRSSKGASSGRRVPGSSRISSEESLAGFLGLTYRPPGDRER